MQQNKFRSWWLASLLLAAARLAAADWEPVEIMGLPYPRLERSARISGTVVVRLSVGPNGSVTEAEAVSGHPLLAVAARKNASGWKFRQSDPSQDTPQDVYLVYRFVLEGSCAGQQCRESFTVEYPNFVLVRSEIPPLQVSRGKSR